MISVRQAGAVMSVTFTETLDVQPRAENSWVGFGPGDPPGEVHNDFYRRALEDLQPKSRVLDFGCGSGYGTAILRAAGHLALGYEPNPLARRYASLAFDAPFVDDLALVGRLDAVVAIESLEHVPDWDATVRELGRYGRRLILTTPLRGYTDPSPWHRHEVTVDELRELLWRHGSVARCGTLKHQPGTIYGVLDYDD